MHLTVIPPFILKCNQPLLSSQSAVCPLMCMPIGSKLSQQVVQNPRGLKNEIVVLCTSYMWMVERGIVKLEQ